MSDFVKVLRSIQPSGDDPHDLIADVSDGWLQGRSLFGGMSGALAVEAASRHAHGRMPRSLLVTFAGPMGGGSIPIRTRSIRDGKSVSVITAELGDADSPGLIAQVSFGDDRTVEADVTYKGSFPGEPLEGAPMAPFVENMMPGFLRNMDIAWTGGGIPGSNTKQERIGMWARFKDDASPCPVGRLVAIGDIPPPAMMAHYNRRIMASSLTWSLQFVVDPRKIDSDWFYLSYRVENAANGYSQQVGHVFDRSETLVAISHQCMTYFD